MSNFHSNMLQLRITSRGGRASASVVILLSHIFIILQFGELKNTTLVRRAFCKEYYLKYPWQVPQLTQFQRMYDRFLQTAASQPSTPAGKSPDFSKEDNIRRVEQFFKIQPKAHIRGAVTELNMSYGKI